MQKEHIRSHSEILIYAKKLIKLQNSTLQPDLWKKFINDILIVWTHGIQTLQRFINRLNSVHSTMKFTSEISSHNTISGIDDICQ